jgi:hypothetical protein
MVEVHHGGFFVGYGYLRLYADEKISWFDHVDKSTWLTLWFEDFQRE